MNEPSRGENPAAPDRWVDDGSSPARSRAERSGRPGGTDRAWTDLGALSREELLERLCDDQVTRWHAGQRVPAEAYLALHPRLEDESEAAFELVYGEFLLREQLGDAPTQEEFCWRFPRFAARLARQLELHGVLNSESVDLDTIVGRAGPSGAPAEKPEAAAVRSVAPGYEILGALGRGGMGAVYKAWQVSLKRVVALKVIRADAYADSRAVARFHDEAEAAARFQHPNIVQVFEVGEHDGLGYIVLEYVAGGALDRQLAGSPQDPRGSARLIESLALAIHYAHQRGIVHRDLKPANVLLTEDGSAKISDFGLAKLMERDEGLTQAGDLLGTPSYMAPEQVRGMAHQITPVTDVYALGAILYEMLTGRPPFKGTTPLSTMEQVSTQEPLTPSRVQRHTPRDLETICLKCLRKDPRRRYGSARDLADDLRRFLDNQPISARPTPAWERAWKWARRRPAAAAAIVCVISAALLLVGLGLYYNRRLRAALLTAQTAEQTADSSAKAALEQRNLALKAFKQLVYDVQEKLGQTPATRSLRQALLNTAIAGLEDIARSTLGSAPDLSRAVAHQKLGDIFRIIGRSAEARRHYDLSRSLAEDLRAIAPGDLRVGQALFQTHMGLGLLNVTADDFGAAKVEFGRAVAIAESIAANAARPEGHQDLIEAYLQLGRAHSFAREFSAAETWFRKMQDLAARWVSSEPSHDLARDLLAASYRKLGDLKKFARDYDGARKDYLTAIALGRGVLTNEPGSYAFQTHLAIGLDDLAGVERSRHEPSEARKLFQEADQLFSALAHSDPDDLDTRYMWLHTQFNLAKLEEDESRFAEALELFRRVLDRVNEMKRDGRLDDRDEPYANPRALATEVAYCAAAPRARFDLDFVHSKPVAVSARLLLLHARTPADSKTGPRRLAAVGNALLGLAPESPEDQFDVARSLAIFVTDLDSRRWPDLAQPERQSLRQRCADRGAKLLRHAVEGGYRDGGLLEKSELTRLRKHPSFRSLEAPLKPSANDPARRVKTSE